MKFTLLALALAGCTVTSTFANPDCEKYPYLDICQEAAGCFAP